MIPQYSSPAETGPGPLPPGGSRRPRPGAVFASAAVLAAVIGAVVGWVAVGGSSGGNSGGSTAAGQTGAVSGSASQPAGNGAAGGQASGSAGNSGGGSAAGSGAGAVQGQGAGSGSSASSTGTGTPHCTAAQLSYEGGIATAAAGTVNVGIKVFNGGSQSCWTYGYPGLQIIDAGGNALPTVTLRGTDNTFQGPLSDQLRNHPARVVLTPGGWGWFDVAYTDVTAPDCPSGPAAGSRLAVIAPDTRAQRSVAVATQACGGKLGVSPILPASTWVF